MAESFLERERLMFEIKRMKIFRDIVHGYVSVPEIFVKELIDTVWFQRIRNIEQTGMRVLYPSGTHHRFSHSLGVYNLGMIGVDQLLQNFREEGVLWNISSDMSCDVFWAKNKVLFLMACLLHDIGHTPYSHGLEKIILENSGKIGHEIIGTINSLENNSSENKNYVSLAQIRCAAHEQLGALLIAQKLKKNIFHILTYLRDIGYPHSEIPIYSEYPTPPPVVNGEDLEKDVAFIMRMIMGIKYKSHHPQDQIKNSFIELLNSSSFDVDKLDYVVRDTQMSGISNTNVDIDRLLSGLTLVTTTEYRNKIFEKEEITFPERTFFKELQNLSQESKRENSPSEEMLTIKGELDAVIQITGPATVTVFQGTIIEKLAPQETSSTSAKQNSKIEFHKVPKFGPGSLVLQGEEKQRLGQTEEGEVVISNGNTPFCYEFQNAKVESKEAVFHITKDSRYDLQIKCSAAHLLIEGKITAESFWLKGQLEGTIEKLSIVGDFLSPAHQIPQKDAFHHYHLGYKKQAFNTISSVLDARHHLYLWIYSHHKVMYYANFLIPYWAEKLISLKQYLERNESSLPPSMIPDLSFSNLENLDDAYVYTMLKLHKDALLNSNSFPKKQIPFGKTKYSISGGPLSLMESSFSYLEKRSRDKRLYEALLTRNYQKSLYKSFPEFDIFFSDFTTEDISKLRGKLFSEVDFPRAYQFFTKEMLNCLAENPLVFQDVVAVDANYIQNKLDLSETFCQFGERAMTMSGINLHKTVQYSLPETPRFYIYYSLENPPKNPKQEEIESCFKKLFRKLIP